MDPRIHVQRGDITEVEVDAIVNAANTQLKGGGGVDGAIHRAAGPKLLEECKPLGGCPTGSATATNAYNLPARYVLHAVGPVWKDGSKGEADLLASCYRTCLQLAIEKDCTSIAFPAISTGVYGYPIDEACKVALETIENFLAGDDQLQSVRLVCFSEEVYQAYRDLQEKDPT